MASQWSADKTNQFKHLVHTLGDIKAVAREMGISASTGWRKLKQLQAEGWDGSDPGNPFPQPLSSEPDPSREFLPHRVALKGLKFVGKQVGKAALSGISKNTDVLSKAIVKRFRGEELSGGKDKGGKDALGMSGIKPIMNALDNHHQKMVTSLNAINLTITRGTATIARQFSIMGDRFTTTLDKITNDLDNQNFGINPKTEKKRTAEEVIPKKKKRSSILGSLVKGKMLESALSSKLLKLGLGAAGLAALGGAGLLMSSSKAHSAIDPNQIRKRPDEEDRPDTNISMDDIPTRTDTDSKQQTANKIIPETIIRGREMTFKAQTITFEADEFDLKDVLGIGGGVGGGGNNGPPGPPPPPDKQKPGQQAAPGQQPGQQPGQTPTPQVAPQFRGQPFAPDGSDGFVPLPGSKPYVPPPAGGPGGDKIEQAPVTVPPAVSGMNVPGVGFVPGMSSQQATPSTAPKTHLESDMLGNPMVVPDTPETETAKPTPKSGAIRSVPVTGGLPTDKFTPQASDTNNISGGAAYLAARRSQFKSELDNNPQTRKLLGAVISSENPGAGPAVAESLFNRTELVNQDRAKRGLPPLTIRDMILGNPSIGKGKSFYGPVRSGAINEHLRKMDDPKFAAQMNARIDQALGGSNLIKGYTDQGSAGDPNYIKGGVGVNINRERFNDWDYHGSKDFRENLQQGYEEAEQRAKTQGAFAGPGVPGSQIQDINPVLSGTPGLSNDMLDPNAMSKVDNFVSQSEQDNMNTLMMNKAPLASTPPDMGSQQQTPASGRDPSDLRTDLNDDDLKSSQIDHFDRGDFGGLGDGRLSSFDIGYA